MQVHLLNLLIMLEFLFSSVKGLAKFRFIERAVRVLLDKGPEFKQIYCHALIARELLFDPDSDLVPCDFHH